MREAYFHCALSITKPLKDIQHLKSILISTVIEIKYLAKSFLQPSLLS